MGRGRAFQGAQQAGRQAGTACGHRGGARTGAGAHPPVPAPGSVHGAVPAPPPAATASVQEAEHHIKGAAAHADGVPRGAQRHLRPAMRQQQAQQAQAAPQRRAVVATAKARCCRLQRGLDGIAHGPQLHGGAALQQAGDGAAVQRRGCCVQGLRQVVRGGPLADACLQQRSQYALVSVACGVHEQP